MIINIDTSLATGTTVTLNMSLASLSINWGDGVTNSSNTHTYVSNGTYTIEILSAIPSAFTNLSPSPKFTSGASFVTSVSSWGSIAWTSFKSLFSECINLTSVPSTLPSTVTDLSFMFDKAHNFNNSNLLSWDTSNVTNMAAMFNGNYFVSYHKFNQPIGNWDVSNVTRLGGMFAGSDFNQPLNNWNTSNVTEMSSMFQHARYFNQPLNNWNTSNVLFMPAMFGGSPATPAPPFNQDISSWDTSNVLDMSSMFRYSPFNKPIGNWNVGSVTTMKNMFNSAPNFNQDIGSWNTGNVTSMESMFSIATSFNKNLNSWNISSVTTMRNMFSFASAFNPNNVLLWNTTGIDVTDWLSFTGPTVPLEEIGLGITVVREASNNRAKITLTKTGTFYGVRIYYRIPDINNTWIFLKDTTKDVDYHLNNEGYFSHSRIEYQADVLLSPFAPPISPSNIVTLSGGKIVRYISETKLGFRVRRIIHNEFGNGLRVDFELPRLNVPKPFLVSRYINPGKYFSYRITDIKTGRAIGSTLKDGKITVEGANQIDTTVLHRFNETFPKILRTTHRISITNGTKVINVGSKGLKLEWGWADKNGTTFTKDVENYGLLYFYPNFILTPPGDNVPKLPIEPPDDIITDKPIIETPEEEDQDEKQICVYDPLNPETRICITADARKDTVCIEETKDGTVVTICNPLPAGAAPGEFINVRRDGDYLTIVFDGEIVVTYKIDPAKFPELANSQGHVGYLDLVTDTFTTEPTFTTIEFPSFDNAIYFLKASYIDRPLANTRPFIYGSKNQAETVYIDKNGDVQISEYVLAQDLVEAQKVFENGLEFEIDTETAQQIWNAGGAKYITAVIVPSDIETVIDVPEDQEPLEGEE